MTRPDDEAAFWQALDALVAGARPIIDRPKGSTHPRYPAIVYPLDYGYLDGTTAIDGQGVDLWRGSLDAGAIVGAVCTVDLTKKDTELKLLIGCTSAEMEIVAGFYNDSAAMKALLLRRRAVPVSTPALT
ncbi:inorganic pyrophosphatase [Rhizobium sp. S-51]|uniref:Inorganic pyrophosphatase n=1 Tax=Rhizobium terricola TaxID=2728849 RepID=A0A7Y0FWJ4_9HYPH|nr:inorganic pyrophosphatase [Rhizobium terricola]NML75583.1 inorganic pyrophosphatase [Rhizobium terricola]